MSSRIEEIKARWAAATPGPWHRNEDLVYTLENGRNRVWWHVLAVGMELRDERISTAHAIANAPEDTRWLVERVERLSKALLAWEDWEASWILNDAAWNTLSGLPRFTDAEGDTYTGIQRLRNEALEPLRKPKEARHG